VRQASKSPSKDPLSCLTSLKYHHQVSLGSMVITITLNNLILSQVDYP
jgi:hypothetical protein